MSTHLTVIDDYHASLIEPSIVRFFIPSLEPQEQEEEVVEEVEEEVETKVVRRGRPRTPKATEGAETK